MKFFKPAAVAACTLFALFACNGLSNSKAENISVPKAEETDRATTPGDPIADTTQTPVQKPQADIKTIQQPKIDWDKKIIKNASIIMDVKNYQSFDNLLHGNIKRFGGYVAQEEQNQTDYKVENSITIKVPVEQFDDFVTSLSTGGQKLIEKKIATEDV